MDEDKTKELAERFGKIRVEHYDRDGEERYDQGFGYLAEKSAENLAREAIVYYQERDEAERKFKIRQIIRILSGEESK